MLLVALGLVAAGCGSRWSDDERAAVFARNAGATSEAVTTVPADGEPGAAPGEPNVVSDPAAGAGSGTTGGTVASDATSPQTGTARPCAAASTAPGVTADAISLGAVNSLSGPVAGLGTSARAATRAYAAHRNATGGVCGRQLRIRDGDDGASGAINRRLVQELSPQVVGFVGGIAGGDDASVDLFERDQVPFLGNSIGPELRRSPIYYGVNLPLTSAGHAIAKFTFLKEQGVRRAALVYSAPAKAEADAQAQIMRAAGINIVLDLALPLTTLSYDSAARTVANAKADYMFFVHEQGGSASMARALQTAKYTVRFPEYIVAYGSSFQELAGTAAEGATSWLYSLPVEDAGSNPELDTFIRWMRQTAPGVAMDTFASMAWAAAKAFVETLEGLPGPISRPALLARAKATDTFDADGLIAPVRFGAKASNGCLIGMVVRDGRWQRLAPAQGFLC